MRPGRRRRFLDRALALQVIIAQELRCVIGKIIQRRQQAALLVVVVVALRPGHFRQRRIRPVPGALVFRRRQRALFGYPHRHCERLVQAADAVVHRRHEHQIARTPGIELAMREHAGHAELGQLLRVVPAELLPFVGQDRIDPGVVRAVADRVVIQERHRFVQGRATPCACQPM